MAKAKNLVIVESPAKAKTIGKYLGPDYQVKASMGHLRDLPKSTLGVDVDALFSAVSPYINEPVTLSLPVVGDFRLDRSDWEKLYRYLKGEL